MNLVVPRTTVAVVAVVAVGCSDSNGDTGKTATRDAVTTAASRPPAAVGSKGPTRIIGEPVVFRTIVRDSLFGGLAYSVVFRLNKDPLSKKPGAENRNFDRGHYSMVGYDLAADSGIHKLSGATLCFIGSFNPPLDKTIRERLARIGVGGRVRVTMAPRGSHGRVFKFSPRIRASKDSEFTSRADRAALAGIGCER